MNAEFLQFIRISSPILILTVVAFLGLMIGAWSRDRKGRGAVFTVSALGSFFALSFASYLFVFHSQDSTSAYLLISDRISLLSTIFILGFALLTLIHHFYYFEKQKIEIPEVYPLTLFSAIGMIVMVSTSNWLLFFLGVELMSFSSYILVASKRNDSRSNEAAMKYFLIGAVGSAVLLYGIACVYGATGQLNVSDIVLTGIRYPKLFLFGVLFILSAFLFKLAIFPFQFWAPDVYEGAPLSVLGWLATATKVAVLVAMIRFLPPIFGMTHLPVSSLLSWLAILTMIFGNFSALLQQNFKRMIAYSSIAHAGYLLVGFSSLLMNGSHSSEAISSLFFYLLSYGILTSGAVFFASLFAQETDDRTAFHFYAGLGKKAPFLTFAMTVFMIGLTGIPLTAGFTAKFFLFRESARVSNWIPVMVGVLMSAVSAVYYLRIVVHFYFGHSNTHETRFERGGTDHSFAFLVLVGVLVFAVLFLGLFPDTLVRAFSF